MEVILFPILFVIQMIVYLFMTILGFIFNLAFRSDKARLADPESNLKPPNPWFVFCSSIVATVFLGCAVGGISAWYWGTASAFYWGAGIFTVLGIFASVTAATGEAPPM